MIIHETLIQSIFPIYLFLGLAFCFFRSEVQSQNILFGLFLISVSISSLIDDYGYIIEDAFLFSPLFLTLYVNKVYQIKTNKYYYLLFFPGILFYDWSSFSSSNDHLHFKPLVVLTCYFISITILLLTLYEYQKFINRIKSNFSEIKDSFQWINTIVILSSIWCLYPVMIILNDLIPFFGSEWFFSTIIYGQYGVLIYLLFKILFIAMGTPTFSDSIPFIEVEGSSINSNDFNESVYDDGNKSGLFSQMQKEIQKNKLYLDPKISLFKLSKSLNMETTMISDLINTQSNDNFYSLINKMRIKEFKCLIEKQEHLKYNLESLAGFCGFNSKSTFYRVFKEIEGITPSDYISKK